MGGEGEYGDYFSDLTGCLSGLSYTRGTVLCWGRSEMHIKEFNFTRG